MIDGSKKRKGQLTFELQNSPPVRPWESNPRLPALQLKHSTDCTNPAPYSETQGRSGRPLTGHKRYFCAQSEEASFYRSAFVIFLYEGVYLQTTAGLFVVSVKILGC